MNATNSISALLDRLSRLLQNDAHSNGLKPTQWASLRYLAQANRFSRNPKALTAFLGMTKGTVSQTLNALERKGLIRKNINTSDRRNVHLELTPAAIDLLDEDPIQSIKKLIEELESETQSAMEKGLKNLLQKVLKQRDGKSFEMCNSCAYFKESTDDGEPYFCSLLGVPLSVEDSTLICVESAAA